jgi:TatA/E family protein of Tat protein translocase
MLNLGWGEMLLILLVASIVFGPNRLPEIARSMGKFLRNFQQEANRAMADLKDGLEPTTTGVFDHPDPDVTAESDQADATQAFQSAEQMTATIPVAKKRPSARSKTTTKPAAKRKPAATAKRKPAAKRPAAKPTPKTK